MKTIYFLIILFLFVIVVKAENIPYFSLKRGDEGLMIGVEIFNQKTTKVINPQKYIYRWTIPSLGIINQTTYSNIIFIPTQNIINAISSLILSLDIYQPLTDEKYSFKDIKLPLAKPRVTIMLKRDNQIFPFISKLKPTDILIVNTYNFPETYAIYYWSFNGIFISNNKEIPVSNLKEKSGIIKVRVFNSITNERVEDAKVIQIE